MATHSFSKSGSAITINGIVNEAPGGYTLSADTVNNILVVKADNGTARVEVHTDTDTVTVNGVSFAGTAAELKTKLLAEWATESRPYKSWAALLNQRAPGDFTSGYLQVGETYEITTYNAGDDFSNCAEVISGTINTTGCIFRAVSESAGASVVLPTAWANASVLHGSGAPWATVLENSIGGTVTLGRDGVGSYYLNLPVASPIPLTSINYPPTSNGNFLSDGYLIFANNGDGSMTFYTNSSTTESSVDGKLYHHFVEIRIYS
jgi:hypothetical protein